MSEKRGGKEWLAGKHKNVLIEDYGMDGSTSV